MCGRGKNVPLCEGHWCSKQPAVFFDQAVEVGFGPVPPQQPFEQVGIGMILGVAGALALLDRISVPFDPVEVAAG